MSDLSVIYAGVVIGDGSQVGAFCEIGVPPRGHEVGELPTILGRACVIRSHTIIYAGNQIGDFFQTGHGALLRESNIIGRNVSLGSHSVVEHHVEIEDDVRIHSQAFIPEYSVLQAGCWIGPNAVLTNARHPLAPNVKENLQGVIIGRGAKIGANATILPGVNIGEMALIGAGSVVTADVPAGVVVVGNPARIIKQVEELVDPSSGEAYGDAYRVYRR